MLHKLGRFLQFVGLFIILPLAIVGQMRNDLTVGQMLLSAVFGMIVFAIGGNLLRRDA